MTRTSSQPSIASVAAAAGVSPTTVSHALSGKRAVSPETRERILQAIEDQKYRPNMVARSLRRRKTQSIALIVADITNPYYPALARAVHDSLAEAGYVSLIGNTDGVRENEQTMLEEMVARGVDGVIMRPMELSGREIREIVGPAIPVVVVADEDETGPVDRVTTDDAQGIDEAVHALHEDGIDDLGFVGDPLASTSMSRHAAFTSAVDELGLRVQADWIVDSEFTRDGGYAAARRLLALEHRPRGIVCANDLIAIGVVQAARDLGIAVPGELAVVGFDDIDTASLMSPALTTVLNPAAAVGATCADLILRRIADPAMEHQRVSLPTRLVRRESA